MPVQAVDSFMTKEVVTLQKNALVREAIQMMSSKGISCIVIVDKNRKPVGIVTERDLVKRVLQMNLNPHATEISVVMSAPVVSVTKQADIFDVMITMQRHNFRRVVVVDNERRVAGLVTQSDLFRGIKKVQLELESINNQMRRELERLKKFTRLKKV